MYYNDNIFNNKNNRKNILTISKHNIENKCKKIFYIEDKVDTIEDIRYILNKDIPIHGICRLSNLYGHILIHGHYVSKFRTIFKFGTVPKIKLKYISKFI